MKLPDIYPADEIVNVPSVEVARWNERIDRINYALGQNTYVSKGGMADDGLFIDEVATELVAGKEWHDGESYEASVLYALKPAISIARVEEVLEPLPEIPMTRRAANAYVEQVVLRDGLERAEIIEQAESAESHIAIGAVAAFLYRRADIAQPIDRELWDRHDEIHALQTTIHDAARPREVRSNAGRSYSVYGAVCWGEEYTDLIAGVKDGPLAWWQELTSDLQRIDHVAGTLAIKGTLD